MGPPRLYATPFFRDLFFSLQLLELESNDFTLTVQLLQRTRKSFLREEIFQIFFSIFFPNVDWRGIRWRLNRIWIQWTFFCFWTLCLPESVFLPTYRHHLWLFVMLTLVPIRVVGVWPELTWMNCTYNCPGFFFCEVLPQYIPRHAVPNRSPWSSSTSRNRKGYPLTVSVLVTSRPGRHPIKCSPRFLIDHPWHVIGWGRCGKRYCIFSNLICHSICLGALIK